MANINLLPWRAERRKLRVALYARPNDCRKSRTTADIRQELANGDCAHRRDPCTRDARTLKNGNRF